ncbi:hypothetical protein SERLA73DRAFT_136997 [Serpula lacrymans var. lacrymans S7.3]|uniref:Uncharacterized protein n=1 Tax=Serpula lacrymans var. lacrymans (strain S7.3) TaxID=936435 RepID=F8PYI0_SERL3|nr:hypothetical protein SERLA73DRAFT_136997 [Serpula lacrymans var. lacrymans S7.3]
MEILTATKHNTHEWLISTRIGKGFLFSVHQIHLPNPAHFSSFSFAYLSYLCDGYGSQGIR